LTPYLLLAVFLSLLLALARIHLDDEVRPPYVREAYRLLRKSIIHVDVQDIDLDDEQGETDDLGKAKPVVDPAEERDFELHASEESGSRTGKKT
jgi:DNA replicative helicase MCM subunit Mcm2 (Cdc46/Mcm family)